MIPEKEENENPDVFFQVLMIGELLTPPRFEGQRDQLATILRHCGITLHTTDFRVLDQSRIGNSRITIARYFLEYTRDAGSAGKRIAVEGIATIQTDELGNTIVRISSKNNPFRSGYASPCTPAPLLSSNG